MRKSFRLFVLRCLEGGRIYDRMIVTFRILPPLQIAALAGIPTLTPVSLVITNNAGQLRFS